MLVKVGIQIFLIYEIFQTLALNGCPHELLPVFTRSKSGLLFKYPVEVRKVVKSTFKANLGYWQAGD